jgi:predicted KAP-like P-loop ATPase
LTVILTVISTVILRFCNHTVKITVNGENASTRRNQERFLSAQGTNTPKRQNAPQRPNLSELHQCATAI